ncbi:MAG: YcnI family protein [Mycobacterium sp.]|uniref:YcnI family copper-binding membrane protein n=3 Tax=Mycobacterium sp. TaxID=1785 RepID=UPI003C4275F6
MSCHRRIVGRALIGAVAAIVLYLGPAAAITTASAHVQASSTDAVRGGTAVVSFQVPNESTTKAATTALTVDLTNVSAVRAEAEAGWTAKLDRDSRSGAVRSVTWTAATGGGIPVDEFGVFRISVKLPDADTVSFPATQTYADGAVVKWDQPPAPGGSEPEHPAPTLVLASGSTPPARQQAPTSSAAPSASATPVAQQPRPPVDNTARILAGAALLVGALGVGVALVVRRI